MSDNDDRFNNPGQPSRIDLEMRVVAWVHGEATDTEIRELEHLIREDAELKAFRDRILAAHELADEASEAKDIPLRLSTARREDLLRRLSDGEDTEAEEAPTVYSQSRLISWRKWIPAGAISVAASIVLIFGVFRMGLYNTERQASRSILDLSMEPPPAPPQSNSEAYELSDSVGVSLGQEGRSASRQSLRQLDETLGERQYAPADELDGRYRQENRPRPGVAAPSQVFKNEGSEKKDFFYAGDLDRVDASKPAAPGRKQTVMVGGSVAAAESSRERRSREAPEEEAVFSLSAFELSADDGLTDYRTTSTLAGTRIQSNLRDVPAAVSVTETSVDHNAVGRMIDPQSKAVSDDFEKSRENRLVITEVDASNEPVSTFSLHVSDVSFRTAQSALARGEWPDAATIRPEEFYNAFDYGDPAPAITEKVACRIEQAAHPYLQQRNLVRIAVTVPATGRGPGQPLSLTVLVDTSGSMEREDRRESIESAMNVLASLLGPDDQVNLIGFARQPRLLEEAMPGNEAHRLAGIIAATPSEGGTNLEEALGLSLQLAQRHFDPAAQNRIVLMTDGAANLGDADPEAFTRAVEKIRQLGISFDACGVGMNGLNDAILEALTRRGNGRYYVLDRPEDADAGFADQLAGAFRPAAENVKVQVRFNPARVGNYRLIGFEKHRLSEEDFRNDRVDAAELAADEAAVAVYQVEVLPDGEGELGEVFVRFRDAGTGEMVERSWTAPFDPHAPAFDRAAPGVQLAGTAAIVAEVLQGDPTSGEVPLEDLAGTVNQLRSTYAHEGRVQELVAIYEQVRRIRNAGTE